MTASLVAAASVVAVFRTAREVLGNQAALSWPLLAAFTYGLGSTMMAYSGLAWHDTLATGYLMIALYLIVRALATEGRAAARPGHAAGCPSEIVGDFRTAQRAVPTNG
jgi:membrane protein implicated in regulation of membrane protease activity